MLVGPEQTEPLASDRQAEDANAPASDQRTLAESVEIAESLNPDDQVRLVTRLWGSLPGKHRAAIIRFGLENLHPGEEDKARSALERPSVAAWSDISKFLFAPTIASELYSAPRRFDLATIFVATAAYSLLFGAMSALSYQYIGPVAEIAVGVLITIVAIAQAVYKDVANPRGVSVLAGAVTQTIMLVVIHMAAPKLFGVPIGFVIVFFGVLGGALFGYLAGVLVGGVFLVADVLRKKFSQIDSKAAAAKLKFQEKNQAGGDSPWAN
jgi:hypothetical protein